jgi:hypothetical protein
VCCFHGPYTLSKPIEQRQIVGSATKDGLTEMKMGLNKTWKYSATGSLNHDIGSLICFAQTRDPAITNQ